MTEQQIEAAEQEFLAFLRQPAFLEIKSDEFKKALARKASEVYRRHFSAPASELPSVLMVGPIHIKARDDGHFEVHQEWRIERNIHLRTFTTRAVAEQFVRQCAQQASDRAGVPSPSAEAWGKMAEASVPPPEHQVASARQADKSRCAGIAASVPCAEDLDLIAIPQAATQGERIRCSRCGKSVSSPVPKDTIVRAWVECPECIERSLPAPAAAQGEEQTETDWRNIGEYCLSRIVGILHDGGIMLTKQRQDQIALAIAATVMREVSAAPTEPRPPARGRKERELT